MIDTHPLTVHLPLALGLVWWMFDAVGLVARRPELSRAGFVLLGLALASAFVATVTGQSAYDRAIACGVAPDLLADHVEWAERLPWLFLGLIALRGLGPARFGRAAELGAVAGGALLSVALVWTGHSGGELVFEHGVGVGGRCPAGAAR